jgi:hypothetical protein
MSNGTGGVDYGSEIGKHIFLPWLRRGIGVNIARADDDPIAAPRASLNVGVAIGPGPLSTAGGATAVPLALYGPGDIGNLQAGTVIRTWPRPNVFEAEPNYFPLVELQPADLPWRYTPARASAKDRLRPWLILIVLRDDEMSGLTQPTANQPTTVVTVKSGASLPPLGQSWAWAHVQITGEDSVDEAAALNLLDHEPHRILARLLCPRRLDPRTAYTGLLVPSVMRAKLAGLHQQVPDAVDGLAPAWQPGDTNIQLPVYYQWRFQTGGEGDFESLVRRVQPRPLPKTVGSRPMDETSPGLQLPPASAQSLNAEAALRALDSTSTDWPAAERSVWDPALQTVLNRPAELLKGPGHQRAVAPPLYGQWYAPSDTVDASAQPQWWFTDLNIDPRMRVGGGTGTRVTQDHQQQYLAGAWAQVAGIRAANAALRAAQLAREAAVRLMSRHFAIRTDASLVAITTPVHTRVTTSPRTVAAVLRESPLTAGLLLPSWRRLTRPRGPIGGRVVRVNAARAAPAANLLERVNSGAVRVAPISPTASGLVTLGRAGQPLAPGWIDPAFLASLTSLLQPTWLVVILVLLVAAVLFLIGAASVAAVVAVAIVLVKALGQSVLNSPAFTSLSRAVALRSGTLTAAQVNAAPMRPAFAPAEFTGTAPNQPVLATGTTESAAAGRFRVAATSLFASIQSPVAPGPVLRSADLALLSAKLKAGLDPKVTIAATFQQRLGLARQVTWTYPDPLEPIMAAPSFDDPMYKPLNQLSSDWILPGLDQVPQDTVSLLRTNQRFVESYMVGVNHEMTRTLLFNEYPIDQRGTYFRQFWDSRASAPPPGVVIDPETQRDIKPIHTWKQSQLGQNTSRQTPSGGDYLVLLLRAELFRRYPNLVVYATRAKWNALGTRDVDDTQESQPIFSGTIGLGVGFWGFALTVRQVRGGPKSSDDPGWFFMLQEAPTEPRCGLEPAVSFGMKPANWPDLSWADLASDEAALEKIVYIDLDAALPDTTGVADAKHATWHADAGSGSHGARASDLAYITYREPVRVAVHASTMIPADAVGP